MHELKNPLGFQASGALRRDLRRRVLFIRSDDAPISRIQNRYRAQVLIKMIDLPVMEPLLQFVQEMVSERENTANGQVTASFEMNPVSLA